MQPIRILGRWVIKLFWLRPSAKRAILRSVSDVLVTTNTYHSALHFFDNLFRLRCWSYLHVWHPFYRDMFRSKIATFPTRSELRLGNLATLLALPIFSNCCHRRLEIGLNLQCFGQPVIILYPKFWCAFSHRHLRRKPC